MHSLSMPAATSRTDTCRGAGSISVFISEGLPLQILVNLKGQDFVEPGRVCFDVVAPIAMYALRIAYALSGRRPTRLLLAGSLAAEIHRPFPRVVERII